jgi:hypothetical protein
VIGIVLPAQAGIEGFNGIPFQECRFLSGGHMTKISIDKSEENH